MKTEANIPYKFYLEEDEALKCKETGEAKTIVFGPTDADLQKGFDGIPHFPGNE